MRLAINLLGYTPASLPWQADYAAEIVPRLARHPAVEHLSIFVTPLGHRYWEDLPAGRTTITELPRLDERKRQRFYAERYILPRMLRESGVDCVFAPLGGSLLRPSDAPASHIAYAYRLQSLAYLNEPWRFSMLEQMFYGSTIPASCRAADRVITDHEALAEQAGLRGIAPRQSLLAIHPGVCLAEEQSSELALLTGLEPGRYLFTAGDDHTGALVRKLALLLEHTKLPPAWEDVGIVWCGRLLAAEPPALPRRVAQFADVEKSLYAVLLHNAAAVLCLGSGEAPLVPLRQALSSGKPVICTDTAAQRCVAGDAALFAAESYSAEAASALASLLGSAELRDTLSASARIRARHFDWDKACAAIMDSLSR